MRNKYLYPIHCVNCFAKMGVSPHNFADKMLYCKAECYAEHRKRTYRIMEENRNDKKNSSSSIKE